MQMYGEDSLSHYHRRAAAELTRTASMVLAAQPMRNIFTAECTRKTLDRNRNTAKPKCVHYKTNRKTIDTTHPHTARE